MGVKPIFIIGCPRSGTTLLFRCLASHSKLWHLESEGHKIFEGPLHPKFNNYESNRFTEVKGDVGSKMRESFYKNSLNLNLVYKNPTEILAVNDIKGRLLSRLKVRIAQFICNYKRPKEIFFLEKTPKNCVRIPFLKSAFPDALFIHLTRNPIDNINSLINGWRSYDKIGPFYFDRFNRHGYEIIDQISLPENQIKKWKFVLVPNWRKANLTNIEEIATYQYFESNKLARMDLKDCQDRTISVTYEKFIESPYSESVKILNFLGLEPDDSFIKFIEAFPKVNGSNQKSNVPKEKLKDAIKNKSEFYKLINEMGYGWD